MIRLGYAYPGKKLLSPQKQKACPESIIEAGRQNLLRIADALEWNHGNGIRTFRIPFETIPFSPSCPWAEHLDVEKEIIGGFVRRKRARLFMRAPPGCSLSSPNRAALSHSLSCVAHCAATLDLLRADSSSRIVLNIGKVHSRRKETAKRFISAFSRLPAQARERIALENDSLYWSFYDVFGLAGKLSLPVVFNYSAFMQNHFTELSPAETIKVGAISWGKRDGPQKICYSESARGRKMKKTLSKKTFQRFYAEVSGLRADIILDTGQGRRSVLRAREYLR